MMPEITNIELANDTATITLEDGRRVSFWQWPALEQGEEGGDNG